MGTPDISAATSPRRMQIGQVVAAVVAVPAAVVWLLLVQLVLSSTFGDGASDPHGYGKIFGSLMLVPVSLVGALALPFVAHSDQVRWRGRATRVAIAWVLLGLVVAGIGLFVDAGPPFVGVDDAAALISE